MALHNLQRGYRGQTIPDQLHHRGVASLRPVIFAVALVMLLSSGDDACGTDHEKNGNGYSQTH